ncbi:hypothetical protein ABEB36_013117 [Hypothenemus hampei]|uniref:Uncharacterized protein n=1 Tax=Hypothenemus hampei TaxID=57062 RepID=A0ABD1E6V6_HYPHA
MELKMNNRMNINILGLSEVRQPGSGSHKTDKSVTYYFGGVENNHRYRPAIFVNNEIANSVVEFVPLSDRTNSSNFALDYLLIINTLFKYHPRRLRTWKSPANAKGRIKENQIEFLLKKVTLKKYIMIVETHPETHVNKDHCRVVIYFKLWRPKKGQKA